MARCDVCEGSGVCQSHLNSYQSVGYNINNQRDDLENNMDLHARWHEGKTGDTLLRSETPCYNCADDDDNTPGRVRHDCDSIYAGDLAHPEKAYTESEFGYACDNCWSGYQEKRRPGTDVPIKGGDEICPDCKGFGCENAGKKYDDGILETTCHDNGLAECHECDGMGYHPCGDCDEGEVDCDECYGVGSHGCPDCNGDLNCPDCKGTGEV